eukprot:CAMPEP_0206524026 /NCGR_PEP_ID=MMETSP0324_2-20121206/67964_1 /ASSEMBLY_ACC=CAM_ASM_000836 /TAXON_ID=2866 /ORGANISM="Crypthecodinium cohnii, Strain Seligo" /LENGTH=281 /DNA_ID=CAMNT_0054018565 /DNA_START=18 /DNA_END=859 /DNA_ORIENTATION=-
MAAAAADEPQNSYTELLLVSAASALKGTKRGKQVRSHGDSLATPSENSCNTPSPQTPSPTDSRGSSVAGASRKPRFLECMEELPTWILEEQDIACWSPSIPEVQETWRPAAAATAAAAASQFCAVLLPSPSPTLTLAQGEGRGGINDDESWRRLLQESIDSIAKRVSRLEELLPQNLRRCRIDGKPIRGMRAEAYWPDPSPLLPEWSGTPSSSSCCRPATSTDLDGNSSKAAAPPAQAEEEKCPEEEKSLDETTEKCEASSSASLPLLSGSKQPATSPTAT